MKEEPPKSDEGDTSLDLFEIEKHEVDNGKLFQLLLERIINYTFIKKHKHTSRLQNTGYH